MTAFVGVAAELVRLAAGLAGVYLAVALVVTLAQAHLQAVAGQPAALAGVVEQLAPVIVCFAVAVNAGLLGDQVAALAGPVGDAGGALAVWEALAAALIRTLIVSVGASLAVGVATGAFQAQLDALTGRPQALADFGGRLAQVVITAVLTLLSLQLVTFIFQAV